MTQRRGECLITVYANVPAEAEAEYHEWYNTHHIPERMKVPGFLSAVRYEAYVGEPKYLTVYELADRKVLKHPQMQHLNANPSDWDKRMSPRVQVLETTIWDRIFEFKEPPESHASRAITVRFSPPAEIESEFNEWYEKEHLPALISVPGMLCGRRYRKRWGDAASSNYLAFYEYDDEAIQSTDAWKKASYTEWTQRLLPKLGTPKLARHRRIFAARGTPQE